MPKMQPLLFSAAKMANNAEQYQIKMAVKTMCAIIIIIVI